MNYYKKHYRHAFINGRPYPPDQKSVYLATDYRTGLMMDVDDTVGITRVEKGVVMIHYIVEGVGPLGTKKQEAIYEHNDAPFTQLPSTTSLALCVPQGPPNIERIPMMFSIGELISITEAEFLLVMGAI